MNIEQLKKDVENGVLISKSTWTELIAAYEGSQFAANQHLQTVEAQAKIIAGMSAQPIADVSAPTDEPGVWIVKLQDGRRVGTCFSAQEAQDTAGLYGFANATITPMYARAAVPVSGQGATELPPLPAHPEHYMAWTTGEQKSIAAYGQLCIDSRPRSEDSGSARDSAAVVVLREALQELCDIVEGVLEDQQIDGLIDSFTLQPAKAALAATGPEFMVIGGNRIGKARQTEALRAATQSAGAIAEWVNDEMGFQRLSVTAIPDGTQLYAAPISEATATKSLRDIVFDGPDDPHAPPCKDAPTLQRYVWAGDPAAPFKHLTAHEGPFYACADVDARLAATSPTGESLSAVGVLKLGTDGIIDWHCSLTQEDAAKLDGMKVYVGAALATPRQTEGGGVSLPDDNTIDSALHDAMAEQLGDLYYCGRVWSAWQVGTMTEDDFSIASEDDDIVYNFVSAAREAFKALLAASSAPTGASK